MHKRAEQSKERRTPRTSDQHACNTRGLHRRNEAAHQRAWCNLRNDLGPGRRQRAQHTDLDPQAAQIPEPAERVRRDDECARGERGGALLHGGEREVGDELVGDEFRADETRDDEQLGARDAHEECERVEDVAEDEVEREVVDAKALADPGEQAVYRVHECQDS